MRLPNTPTTVMPLSTTCSARSKVTLPPGRPTPAARPPLRSAARPESNATGLPLISSKTSVPLPPVSLRIASRRFGAAESRTTWAPMTRASASLCGFGSTAMIFEAPAAAATPTAMSPIDPAAAENLQAPARSRHADGHEPDRPGAGDQDGLQTDVTDRNSVDCVAERVEDGGPFIRHAGIELPDVALGHGDVVGETAVAIHADHFDGGADVRLTRATQETGAVRDVAFGRHALADAHAANGGADRGDDAHEFMPDDQRRAQAVLRPRVPGPDVRVGAADAGLEHADEHVVGTDRGNRHFAQSHAGTGPLFDECTHAARDVVPRSRGANWLRYGHKSRIFGQHFWIAFANFVP